MRTLDLNIGKYCAMNEIRYTRYADDLTFSGNIDIAKLLYVVDGELKYLGLQRNEKKLKVMHSGTRQKVTGIVVNDVQQLSREYRLQIRQEVHYIDKFGLNDHLSHTKETRENYLSHLIGKIQYAIFINPRDKKMIEYLKIVNKLKEDKKI